MGNVLLNGALAVLAHALKHGTQREKKKAFEALIICLGGPPWDWNSYMGGE